MNERNRPLENSVAYDSTYSSRRKRRISRNRVTARLACLFMIFAFVFYTWLALNKTAFVAYSNYTPAEPLYQVESVPDAAPSAMIQTGPPIRDSGEDNYIYHAIENDSTQSEISNIPSQPENSDLHHADGPIQDIYVDKPNGWRLEIQTHSTIHDDPEPCEPQR